MRSLTFICNGCTIPYYLQKLQPIMPAGPIALYSRPHIKHLFPMVEKRKGLYLTAGFLLTALAAVGIILPLLPTTPLLLLAAWCFANSSEKSHRWLIEHRLFGPIIHNWQEKQCIPLKPKIIAISMILIFGTYAIGFAIENIYIRIVGGVFCLIGLTTVLRLKVCKK